MTTKRNSLYDRNDNKRFDEQQKNNKRMSVPDLIPSHELNNVAHMRIQNNEIQKTGLPAKSTNLLMDHRIPKRKSLHASNKDIADLAEKGLPSVRDLVNKFIPYRTGSVNLHRSPEPKPRHSLSQKVILMISLLLLFSTISLYINVHSVDILLKANTFNYRLSRQKKQISRMTM